MSIKAKVRAGIARAQNKLAEFVEVFAFEQITETPDGQGGYSVSWSNFVNIQGFTKQASENEIKLDDHIKTNEVKKFSFEYVAGLKTDMRILYKNDYYNIHKIESIQDSDLWINVYATKNKAT